MSIIDHEWGTGVAVTTPFEYKAAKPLDARVAVNSISERDALVTNGWVYPGMQIYVTADEKTYLYKGKDASEVAIWDKFALTSQVASETGKLVAGYYHDGKFWEDTSYTAEIAGDSRNTYVDITNPDFSNIYRYVSGSGATAGYKQIGKYDENAYLTSAAVDVGGIKTGDDLSNKSVKEVLQLMVSPVIHPSINEIYSLGTVAEIGTTIEVTGIYTNFNLSPNVAATELKLYVNDGETPKMTYTLDPLDEWHVFNTTGLTEPIVVGDDVWVDMIDETGEVKPSDHITIEEEFWHPYYVGNTTVASMGDLMNSEIQGPGCRQGLGFEYTNNPFDVGKVVTGTELNRVFFAVPQGVYASITIKDQNGYVDYTNTFYKESGRLLSDEEHDPKLWEDIPYDVYLGPMGGGNFTYKVSF